MRGDLAERLDLRAVVGDRCVEELLGAGYHATQLFGKIAGSGASDIGIVRALDQKGSPIGEANFSFGVQDVETEASFELPVELRNDIARLEISGERSAGAVQLLCNIHSSMLGWIYVVDTPWFSQADVTGHFAIKGVPPGEYLLSVWHEAHATGSAE